MAKTKFTKEMPVRALDNQQVRALRAAGLHPDYVKEDERKAKFEDMTDWIIDNVYADIDFTGVAQIDCLSLAADTYRKTYGRDEETKNS